MPAPPPSPSQLCASLHPGSSRVLPLCPVPASAALLLGGLDKPGPPLATPSAPGCQRRGSGGRGCVVGLVCVAVRVGSGEAALRVFFCVALLFSRGTAAAGSAALRVRLPHAAAPAPLPLAPFVAELSVVRAGLALLFPEMGSWDPGGGQQLPAVLQLGVGVNGAVAGLCGTEGARCYALTQHRGASESFAQQTRGLQGQGKDVVLLPLVTPRTSQETGARWGGATFRLPANESVP